MQPTAPATDIIFYDGTCGLCHRWVQWALARDPDGFFRFAPLQGDTFRELLSDERRTGLPDSVVVLTRDNRLLVRSEAAIYIAAKIGATPVLAPLAKAFPVALRDALYDVIARTRYRIFGRKDQVCPIIPPELRGRFLP